MGKLIALLCTGGVRWPGASRKMLNFKTSPFVERERIITFYMIIDQSLLCPKKGKKLGRARWMGPVELIGSWLVPSLILVLTQHSSYAGKY